MSLLGAAALTASLLALRQQREAGENVGRQIPAGEKTARVVTLDRLRELGL